ncbi:cryptochrome/photolyase family protein [Gluconobacter morbifer]|uniref:Deoxyribodipyrimidine photo-lyase n=1 Tax=Gluconobacter morbifer G707 TaxID=1088869 RepID=G6XJI5_9PROT|nr:deoxyribodipyrimidine photo-lyase [Gluconobacter morbifer]EHH68090.1 deoxyribodipyrimidine photolyase [Gluconobacter morbifer G707]
MSPASSLSRPVIVCFRDDLRMADHPALHEAAASGAPVLCVYVLDDETSDLPPPGAASRWWLHGTLADLRGALEKRGGTLLTLGGPLEKILPRLAEETNARCIYWHHRLHEKERQQDERLIRTLNHKGVEVRAQWGSVLLDPERIRTKEGGFYRVYTSFWKALQGQAVPEPLDLPSDFPFFRVAPSLMKTDRLDEAALLPRHPDWAGGLRSTWEPGEREAHEHLTDFLHHEVDHYGRGRDLMAEEGTSRLSPYLASGAISPRQVWATVGEHGLNGEDARIFRSEIGWREFARYTLYHFPQLCERNLNRKFDALSWRRAPEDLRAWQKGQTGIPVVDAAMRQLWQTGWMHNRARMIVGSFLTKHLLVDWREGEAWFWDTLVDADRANNTMNWQWVAGTGIDAAPFFRVFNPSRQAEKFDPDGDYIRRWVPELAKLSGKALVEPWKAQAEDLHAAGVTLGKTYPHPIVDLAEGRSRALVTFRSL